MLEAAKPRAINKLHFSDFRSLVLRQDVDDGIWTSELLQVLLKERAFKDVKQKLNLLLALKRKGHKTNYLAHYLEKKEISYLSKKVSLTPAEKELLDACKKKQEPVSRYYQDVSIYQLKRYISFRKYLGPGKRFSMVYEKVAELSLESSHFVKKLESTLYELSKLVHKCGISVIPRILDAIDLEDMTAFDIVIPFLFDCLSRFQFSELENYLDRLFKMLESESLRDYAVELIAKLGKKVKPLILERLAVSKSESEYLLRALSQIS